MKKNFLALSPALLLSSMMMSSSISLAGIMSCDLLLTSSNKQLEKPILSPSEGKAFNELMKIGQLSPTEERHFRETHIYIDASGSTYGQTIKFETLLTQSTIQNIIGDTKNLNPDESLKNIIFVHTYSAKVTTLFRISNLKEAQEAIRNLNYIEAPLSGMTDARSVAKNIFKFMSEAGTRYGHKVDTIILTDDRSVATDVPGLVMKSQTENGLTHVKHKMDVVLVDSENNPQSIDVPSNVNLVQVKNSFVEKLRQDLRTRTMSKKVVSPDVFDLNKTTKPYLSKRISIGSGNKAQINSDFNFAAVSGVGLVDLKTGQPIKFGMTPTQIQMNESGRLATVEFPDKPTQVLQQVLGSDLSFNNVLTIGKGVGLTQIVMSPYSQFVLKLAYYGPSEIFNLMDGSRVHLGYLDKDVISNSAVFSRDGKRLVLEKDNSTILFFDTKTGTLATGKDLSQIGKIIFKSFVGDSSNLFIVTNRSQAFSIDPQTLNTKFHTGVMNDVKKVVMANEASRALLISTKRLQILNTESGLLETNLNFDQPLLSASISPDARFLALSKENGELTVLDLNLASEKVWSSAVEGSATNIQFRKDSGALAITTGKGEIQIIELFEKPAPPEPQPAE